VATTSLFSTGISVKNLHSIIMANMGKSFTQCIQTCGRVLRLHDSKKQAKVFDVIDTGLRYSESHGASRVEHYDAEQFENKIVEIEI